MSQIIERLARLGYLCKGAVYVIVGLLAAAAAVRRSGEGADRNDAFRFILDQPFGRLTLLLIAVGLVGYAVWRVSSGVTDSEKRGNDAKGVALRAGSTIRGLFYGWVAVEVVRLALRRQSGAQGDEQARHWTSRALDQPFGRWLVAIAGMSLVGYALYQLYAAVRGKLSKQIRARRVPPLLLAISRFGLGARALVFAIIGLSLLAAAVRYDPGEARSTAGALGILATQPFGRSLLALTGAGLAAYGVYAFVNARYREMAAA